MPMILMGFAAGVFAAPAADRGLELRQRLDSVEVETQVRKRQGKPIEDLEALSAELRDTLVGLRGNAPQTAPQREDREEGGAYLGIPFLEDVLAFRPSGAFDWVIVGTGAVALLSGLALIIGLFAGRKKKRPAAPKKQQASRKINLAPTSTAQRAVPDVNNNNNEPPPPRDSVAEFQSLVENLRKVAPPPFAGREQEPRGYALPRRTAPPPAVDEPEPRKTAPPPPEPPPPLIVNAPESPSAPPPAVLSGKPLASELLSKRTPPMPTAEQAAAASSQKQPSSTGAGFPAFSTLVVAAAKDGLGEVDISRRYQLSVDQVRLILRMEQNKK